MKKKKNQWGKKPIILTSKEGKTKSLLAMKEERTWPWNLLLKTLHAKEIIFLPLILAIDVWVLPIQRTTSCSTLCHTPVVLIVLKSKAFLINWNNTVFQIFCPLGPPFAVTTQKKSSPVEWMIEQMYVTLQLSEKGGGRSRKNEGVLSTSFNLWSLISACEKEFQNRALIFCTIYT